VGKPVVMKRQAKNLFGMDYSDEDDEYYENDSIKNMKKPQVTNTEKYSKGMDFNKPSNMLIVDSNDEDDESF